MAKEEWRPVRGFEAIYEVSNLGRVKRLAVPRYCGGGRYARTAENITSGYVDSQGYCSVSLGRTKKITVHRLVCEAFHGPVPKGKNYVAHFDGDKQNNRAENLRWTSAKENNGHDASRLGTTCAGEKAWKAKLTAKEVLEIRKEYDDGGRKRGLQAEIARKRGLTRRHVSLIVLRTTWQQI